MLKSTQSLSGELLHLLFAVLLTSAPSLAAYYFLLSTLSVCPSVCLSQTLLLLFFFLDAIKPFLGHQFSITKTTKHCSLIFDLRPKLTPQNLHKIAYKSASMADRPEMFGPTRGFSGMADSMEPCKMLWGRPLLMATKFGLGAEIQSPTGLSSSLCILMFSPQMYLCLLFVTSFPLWRLWVPVCSCTAAECRCSSRVFPYCSQVFPYILVGYSLHFSPVFL